VRPTEILKNEHQVLLIALDAIDHLEQALAQGGPFPGALVGRILDFMTVYAEKYHYFKEEQLLLPRLERRGMSAAGGPIGLIRQEHAMGRHRTAQALKLLPAGGQGRRARPGRPAPLSGQHRQLAAGAYRDGGADLPAPGGSAPAEKFPPDSS